jgi:hypothetical protein
MKALILNAVAATLLAATAGCSSMGMGHGMGGGRGMSGAGTGMGMGEAGMAESMPGWSMMSEKEREEHRARMRSGMSAAECQRYMEEHHRMMSERAKERGVAPPGEMRPGMCAGMQQR